MDDIVDGNVTVYLVVYFDDFSTILLYHNYEINAYYSCRCGYLCQLFQHNHFLYTLENQLYSSATIPICTKHESWGRM